jgi:5'-3' exonuclease
MGIPSYFSYIIKNYKNIVFGLKKMKESGIQIDNLYMDCNSIIYDAISNVVFDENIENNIIKNVVENIETYIQLIKPKKTVFIAFDGVAPLAKMKQQKTRRYKTYFMSKIDLLNDNKTAEKWNTSKITPGTEFMNKLSKKITFHFNDKEREKEYNVKNIIVSTSEEVSLRFSSHPVPMIVVMCIAPIQTLWRCCRMFLQHSANVPVAHPSRVDRMETFQTASH